MFDAVLLIAFGGPQGPADVRPFLERVLRGRRVHPGRIDEVAHHYDIFGGVSPITELTGRQAEGLKQRLAAAGRPLPVYVGMRNWHPLLADTLRRMHEDGVRHAIGFIAAAHHCYSSCQQYREHVDAARAELRAATGGDVRVTYVESWFDHPLFAAAQAGRVRAALQRLPQHLRREARVVFTAHSIPAAMAEASRYQEQLRESGKLIAEKAAVADWTVVYQSRSGRPEDPWLEPDVCDYLRDARRDGLAAAVLCPLGFVCDHVEVLYDLDHEAAAACRDIDLPMSRAQALNDDPVFMDMMADVVLRSVRRYERGRPLPIAAGRKGPPYG
jgi:ferrochelatase